MARKPAKKTLTPDERELVIKKIDSIKLYIQALTLPLELSNDCACFFWGGVGAEFIINKLNDLYDKNKEIAVYISFYDENTQVTRTIELNYSQNYSFIQSLKDRRNDYKFVGELLVINDGLEPKYILQLHQLEDFQSIELVSIVIEYVSHPPSIIDPNNGVDLDDYQAAFRKVLCKHQQCIRKILYDSVVQILQEQYENTRIPIYHDIESVEYYIDELGIKLNYVDAEVIKKMWSKNISDHPDEYVELPTIMLKGGHCPITSPRKFNILKIR